MGNSLPSGVVTFLFTDVVGSTRLWEADPVAMGPAMVRHDALIEAAVAKAGGIVVRPRGEGDSRFAVFTSAMEALTAAAGLSVALAAEPWRTPEPVRVRVAVHTGEADLRAGDYYGDAVNRTARLRALAHPGQILLSQATAAVVGRELAETPLGVRDLGTHRLKDLTRGEQVFQLTHPDLPTDHPALLSLDRARHNLPVQLSSFVGRQGAIAELVALVGAEPLVTVTGFGGMGKTRLALQVGAQLGDGEGDGVWFIDLSAVRDAALIPEAITRVLGVPGGGDVLATLTTFLADKRLLLICDNLEQLLPEAAQIIATLAAAGPGVRVLATSREAVGVRGECVYPLLPLPSPGSTGTPETVESLGAYDAATLFRARARGADPTFRVDDTSAPALAAICATLDGWPLALELAAARVRLLGLPGLLSRLGDRLGVLTGGARDLPDRQRTLRATIAWSYDLLNEDEQSLFVTLAVFAGGATLDAVEAVCAEGLDVLEVLRALVDKSLVRIAETAAGLRYRLPEPIRDFAAETLGLAPEREVLRQRHAAFFQNLFTDPDHGPATESDFRDEVPNIRSSLDYLTAENPERACQLIAAVDFRLCAFGHFAEASERCHQLKALPGLSPAAVAALEVTSGSHAIYLGRVEDALAQIREPTAKLLALNEGHPLAFKGCFYMATLLAARGETTEAMVWAHRTLDVASRFNSPKRLPQALSTAAYVSRVAGDLEAALSFAQRAVDLTATSQDHAQRAEALDGLCRTLVQQGQGRQAIEYGKRLVEHCELLGGVRLAYALGALGRALLVAGDHEAASRLLVRAAQLMRDAGMAPDDLGWAAVAMASATPSVGAAVLAVHDQLMELNPDPDQLPPPDLLARVRALYERSYPEAMTRGRELGWPAVVSLLDALDLGDPTQTSQAGSVSV